MKTKYAIRYYEMYVRKDGLMTDNKSAALLFDSQVEAEQYTTGWKIKSKVEQTGKSAEIVEVEVKEVMHKAVKVVSII